MKTPDRGISRNKVKVMSLENRPDGNRLVDHFKYLVAKGHQVDADQRPKFFSNIGSTRKEVIQALEEYRNNFIESKKAGTMSRNVRLLGKGIVFCNLPHSMTPSEYDELTKRLSEALPPEMPQIFVFHNKNRSERNYGHLHLLLGVNGDGGQMMSKEFRDTFHEKLIDVVEKYTAELGYKRDVQKMSYVISNKATKLIRDLARQEAANASEKNVHRGMLTRLKSKRFWDAVAENRIQNFDFSDLQIMLHAREMARNCQAKRYKYDAEVAMAKYSKGNNPKKSELEPLELALDMVSDLKILQQNIASGQLGAAKAAEPIEPANTVLGSTELDVLLKPEPKPQIEIPAVRNTEIFFGVEPEPVISVTKSRRR